MKTNTLTLALLLSFFVGINAQYVETMDPNGLIYNLKDYNLLDDDATNNQSAIFQKGIDDLATKGGGILIVPKGTYLLANVSMKSNVHLQIEANTVLKPDWPAGEKVSVFNFAPIWDVYKKNKAAYIENVSIRGLGGRFIVDYHNRIVTKGEGCRAIVIQMVKNFLIQDMDIKDNYTVYCGMVLSPSKDDNLDVSNWEVSRATDGTIRNCRHYKASPGYGLVQLHGARRIHFENLYSLGGVTLRLETGANSAHVGVHDITAKNITCENGRCALMMGPHSAKNGTVTVDSLTTISCTYAVTVGMGGVKDGAPDTTPGYFANNSAITNVHAIYGTNAQIKKQGLLYLPVKLWDHLRIWPDNRFLDGPSIGAVQYHPETYSVKVENVTMEGFEYVSKTILTNEDERAGNVWSDYDAWFATHNTETYKSNKGQVIADYDIPTAINPIQSNVSLHIYPNPVRNIVFIKGEELSNSNLKVAMYNSLGKLEKVKNKRPDGSGSLQVEVNDLKSGIYAIQIINSDSNNRIGSYKILVK